MEHGSKWYTEEEKQIALILLHLRHAKPPLPNWGRKRKRSAIQDHFPVPLHFTLTPLHHHAAAVASPSCDAQPLTAPSPATPLSFSPTESDEKLNNFRRKPSLPKRKEVYLKTIKDLTESIALLNQEVGNVKGYCDQLKAFNLKLKARKQELINGSKRKCKKANLEFSRSKQTDHVNASVNPSNSMAENEQHKQSESLLQLHMPMPMPNTHYYNQMSGQSQTRNGEGEGVAQFQRVSDHPTTSLQIPSSSSSAALGHVNSNKGPPAIPDLNFTPEEFTQVDPSQPLDERMANKDLSRAMAAQARQRRIQIFRLKNPIRTSKSICSYR
ncbi:hypothetical protein VNO77_32763 [Canavalia gladiata]|uniref:Uncharacterized protein n=1 Tax=Canavalia gladiata TaxID=3824 RepID=A0AAN9KT46_CANGL